MNTYFSNFEFIYNKMAAFDLLIMYKFYKRLIHQIKLTRNIEGLLE